MRVTVSAFPTTSHNMYRDMLPFLGAERWTDLDGGGMRCNAGRPRWVAESDSKPCRTWSGREGVSVRLFVPWAMAEDAVSAQPCSTLLSHRLDDLDRRTLNGDDVMWGASMHYAVGIPTLKSSASKSKRRGSHICRFGSQANRADDLTILGQGVPTTFDNGVYRYAQRASWLIQNTHTLLHIRREGLSVPTQRGNWTWPVERGRPRARNIISAVRKGG